MAILRDTDSLNFPLDTKRLRDDFPILSTRVHNKPLVYLDNAASTQHPRQVTEAMVGCYEGYYANVHRGIHALSEACTERYEAARTRVQQFLGAAHAHECIFTPGTTGSINLVARAWGDANVGPDDEILVTEMEHHSNLVPWHQLAERTGCTIRAIPIDDEGHLCLENLDSLLTARTKLVALASVSNVLGTINPVVEIVRRAHGVGALVLVDAAQSVPHLATDVQAMDCDFLAFSAHKMCGPSGVGVLYAKERILDAMPPFLGGGSMIERVDIDRFTPGELPAKFEAGTPPIAPAIGLAAAIEYLASIGFDAIHSHEQALNQQAHEVLSQLKGVRIFGPLPSQKSGIVSFTLSDVHPSDLAQLVDLEGIAIRAGHHCTMPLHQRLGVRATARASFYFYNEPEEIDALAESIARAQHKLVG